jgi:hypothetical protein
MWPFNKKLSQDKVEGVEIISQKPSDGIISTILDERFEGYVAYQWVNWASEQIGEQPKYFIGYPMTPRSLWVLYEGCRIYVEGTKNDTNAN